MIKTDTIESSNTLEKVLNILPQIAWTAFPSGQVNFYNNEWHKYTNLPSSSKDDAWKTIVHPDDIKEIKTKFKHALINKDSFTTEIRYKNAEGNYRWHLVKASPIKDKKEHVFLWIFISTDIHDRKRSKEELQEIEYRYKTLIEESSVATALYIGSNLLIQYANEIMIGYWGKENNVIGKLLRDAIPELKGQPFLDILKTVYTTGIPYIGKEEKADLIVGGKLQSFYFDFTYKALRDKDGNIYGIHHMAVDVTNQVVSRKKIQESEERFRLMVQQAPVAMLVFRGENLVFETVNNEMLVLIDRDSSILGKPALEAMPELETQPVWQIVKNVYFTGEPFFANEMPVQIVKNGIKEQGYYTFSYIPLKEHDKTVGILHVAVDMTVQVKARMAAEEATKKIETSVIERTRELAEANKRLQKSNAELAQFAYIASHDLQEPLRKISTFSQMLEHSLDQVNDTTKNYLNKINNSTTRMAKLIKDVLRFSQLGNEDETFEMVNLQQIIEGAKTDYELSIEQKQAVIKCDNLPTIQAIPLQMAQLFGNLLSNSLKYAKPDVPPLITISCHPLTKEQVATYFKVELQSIYFKIEFVDNGIGFQQEYADRIFNIFQRLHGKTEFAGTGIGLALCKKIAQNHHGDIFASGQPGIGAVFTLLLPYKQE